MVHNIYELCKIRTSGKWETLTFNLAQDVLDIRLSLGKFIGNACLVKVTKEKKKKSSAEADKPVSANEPPITSRGEKFVTKKNILYNRKTSLFGNKNLPAIVLQQIISFLDIKSILNFSSSCKTVTKVMSQGFWKKLIQRDFPKSKVLSTKETYSSLYRKKQSFVSAEVELTDKISSLEDKMDKCSATLKTKETELNKILNPEGSHVSQIAEKSFTVICEQNNSSSKDGYV